MTTEGLKLDWKLSDKYTLRPGSIKKRMETQEAKTKGKRVGKKRGPKPRPRPVPMSKYRRKTANMRERERMGEINVAFEHLKEKIPTPLATSEGSGKAKCEKMTKINILHVAINYIKALESILDTGDAGVHVYGTAIVSSPKKMPEDLQEKVMNDIPVIASKTLKMKRAPKVKRVVKAKKPPKVKPSDHGKDQDVEEVEDSKPYCPDWTELTCTFDFPSSKNSSLSSGSLHSPSAPSSPESGYKTDMDTLMPDIFNPRDQMLLTQALQSLPESTTATKVPLNIKPWPSKGCEDSGLFSRQISFSELGQDPDVLFGELDSLDLTPCLSSSCSGSSLPLLPLEHDPISFFN